MTSLNLPEDFKQAIGYREAETFAFCIECRLDWGVLDHAIEWCRNQCVQDWRWQLIMVSNEKSPGHYCFYFDSERDYVAFTLQWG